MGVVGCQNFQKKALQRCKVIHVKFEKCQCRRFLRIASFPSYIGKMPQIIATECLVCPIQPHTYAAITCVRMEQRVSVRKQTVHQPTVYVLRATMDTTVTTVGWSEI